MAESFGQEVTNLHLSARGEMTIDSAKEFAIDCVTTIGMTCSHASVVFDYPERNGVYIGFVLIQPLIESYCVIDYWANHKAFYLNITSCKDFEAGVVEALLKKYGFERRTIAGGFLSL